LDGALVEVSEAAVGDPMSRSAFVPAFGEAYTPLQA
jgi:hypothetical protein